MPLAGVVWQVLHYLEGFRRLGFDVYYVEDTGAWPYNPEENTVAADSSYSIGLLGQLMKTYGFSDRWAYRDVMRGGCSFGLSESQIRRLFEQTDILVNLTASTVLRTEHLRVPLRVYLETDPVLPQIEVAKGNSSYLEQLGAHTHHFTYGENLGAPDCGVPVERFRYFPTRQPVVLDWWTGSSHSGGNGATLGPQGCFTTIANWRQSGKDFDWNGVRYTWSKHHEFLKFLDLPKRARQPLELALALKSGAGTEKNSWSGLNAIDAETVRLLTSHGWQVVNAMSFSKQTQTYRDYILRSRGEFTVAKDQNVRLRSGWFSDRSACYLAAGRPVITQDTGFGKVLPTGDGLFAFNSMEDILSALERINSDEPKHSRAARAIAETYFKAEIVLAKLIADLGL
ncbi:MAG: glycosyltransferase [Candidatus Binatia bacterium]